MRLMFKILGHIILFVILTILSQIGGIVYLLTLPIFHLINRRFNQRVLIRLMMKYFSFLTFYFIISVFIVPPVAKAFGRVPLPVFSDSNLKPLSLLTCALNRHYVTPEFYSVITASAIEMNQYYPGTVTTYLDANFPFLNGFPLLPHLSHNDGKKIDLAFYYKDNQGRQLNHYSPSWIGYGVFEAPKPGEENTPEFCEKEGYWQYSILEMIARKSEKDKTKLDEERTRKLIKLMSGQNIVSKVFIEPHLKSRMRINSQKVRFHGCGAVRHDDHIHVQIK